MAILVMATACMTTPTGAITKIALAPLPEGDSATMAATVGLRHHGIDGITKVGVAEARRPTVINSGYGGGYGGYYGSGSYGGDYFPPVQPYRPAGGGQPPQVTTGGGFPPVQPYRRP